MKSSITGVMGSLFGLVIGAYICTEWNHPLSLAIPIAIGAGVGFYLSYRKKGH